MPSILELLGKLIKSENCIHLEFFVNWTFLRGIFSFFDHPLDTVRLSAAQFLVSIFDLAHAGTLNWTQYLFTTSDFELRIASLLQLVYRRFFTEGNDQIVGRLTVVWKRLIDGACDVDQRLFVRSVCKLVGMWLSFLMVPDGSPKLDPSHLKMFDSDQFFNSDWDLASPQCIIGGEDFIALPSESQQRLDLVTKTKVFL